MAIVVESFAMPSKMSAYTLAIAEAAETIGISIHHLDWWCEWHGAYLSPGANPSTGQMRRLTGIDIEVLQHAKALRSEGFHTLAINHRLSDLTVTAIADSDVQLHPIAVNTVIAYTSHQKTPPQNTEQLWVRQDIDRRVANIEHRRVETITKNGMGVWISLLVATILLGLRLYGAG